MRFTNKKNNTEHMSLNPYHVIRNIRTLLTVDDDAFLHAINMLERTLDYTAPECIGHVFWGQSSQMGINNIFCRYLTVSHPNFQKLDTLYKDTKQSWEEDTQRTVESNL